MSKAILYLFMCLCGLQGYASDTSFWIFHTNDTHAQFESSTIKLNILGNEIYTEIGGLARLAEKVNSMRREKAEQGEESLLLHGGDSFQGSLYFTQNQGRLSALFMNRMGYDAAVLGNHEFDLGSESLSQFILKSEFDILAANINVDDDAYLKGLIKPYTLKTISGTRVAIIGLLPENTRILSSPSQETRFLIEKTAAQNTINRLKAIGINHIILLTHIGLDRDITLANELEGVDAIIGGHSHTLTGSHQNIGLETPAPYPLRETSPEGNLVCIGQAWKWGRALGSLKLEFNKNGTLKDCQGQSNILIGSAFWKLNEDSQKISLDQNTEQKMINFIAQNDNIHIVIPSPDITDFLNPYKNKVEEFGSQVITTMERNFLHIRSPGRHPSGVNLSYGSEVAPRVAISLSEKLLLNGPPIHSVLINSGGVRSDIQKGPFTVKDIYTLLPFGNSLVRFKIKAYHLKAILDKALDSHGGFGHLSHIQYTYDLSRPIGARITSLRTIGDTQEIDDEMTLDLATSNFLYNGGDGYDFKESKNPVDTGFLDHESLLESLKLGPFQKEIEPRVIQIIP